MRDRTVFEVEIKIHRLVKSKTYKVFRINEKIRKLKEKKEQKLAKGFNVESIDLRLLSLSEKKSELENSFVTDNL